MDFEKGMALYREGKFEEALEIFNELVSANSGKAEFHLYRGRILTRLGRGDAALEDFDLLIRLEPYNTDYISDRGVVLHLLGKNEEALSELDRAANLDPKNPYRYSSRAFLKDRIGDLYGAIEDYEKAIELDPEDAVSYNNKGLVEEKLGLAERSKKSFETSDGLVGYNPQRPADSPAPGTNDAVSDASRSSSDIDESKKVSSGYFWNTLKALMTDPKTRSEFGKFLREFFSGKKTKNS